MNSEARTKSLDTWKTSSNLSLQRSSFNSFTWAKLVQWALMSFSDDSTSDFNWYSSASKPFPLAFWAASPWRHAVNDGWLHIPYAASWKLIYSYWTLTTIKRPLNAESLSPFRTVFLPAWCDGQDILDIPITFITTSSIQSTNNHTTRWRGRLLVSKHISGLCNSIHHTAQPNIQHWGTQKVVSCCS